MGNWNDLREPRQMIVLHYDASVSDESAVQWLLHDPRCKVSYSWIVLDDGNVIPIAPEDKRAWHAGVCRSSDPRLTYGDANSAGYGIAIAATAGDVATLAQKRSVAALCRTLFLRHGWPVTEVWRTVSHRTEAWPRGRKNDPEGPDLAHPVMNTNEIRGMVAGAWP